MDRTRKKVKKVFICSPFSPEGDTEEEKKKNLMRNVSQAQLACRYASLEGYIPYAPHLYFTQYLNDEDKEDREFGQEMGLLWLKSCDELWVIGRRISCGMHKEIKKARRWGIPIKHYVSKRTPEERILDAVFYPGINFIEMM